MVVSPNSLPEFDHAIFLRAVDTHIEDGSIPSQSTFEIDDKTSVTQTTIGSADRIKAYEFFGTHTSLVHAIDQLSSQLFVYVQSRDLSFDSLTEIVSHFFFLLIERADILFVGHIRLGNQRFVFCCHAADTFMGIQVSVQPGDPPVREGNILLLRA